MRAPTEFTARCIDFLTRTISDAAHNTGRNGLTWEALVSAGIASGLKRKTLRHAREHMRMQSRQLLLYRLRLSDALSSTKYMWGLAGRPLPKGTIVIHAGYDAVAGMGEDGECGSDDALQDRPVRAVRCSARARARQVRYHDHEGSGSSVSPCRSANGEGTDGDRTSADDAGAGAACAQRTVRPKRMSEPGGFKRMSESGSTAAMRASEPGGASGPHSRAMRAHGASCHVDELSPASLSLQPPQQQRRQPLAGSNLDWQEQSMLDGSDGSELLDDFGSDPDVDEAELFSLGNRLPGGARHRLAFKDLQVGRLSVRPVCRRVP